jgi:hypothetical protein
MALHSSKVPCRLQVAQMKPLRRASKVIVICGFLYGYKCRNGGKGKGECKVKLMVICGKTMCSFVGDYKRLLEIYASFYTV